MLSQLPPKSGEPPAQTHLLKVVKFKPAIEAGKCERGRPDHQDELCAQWHAALAARNGAWWTMVGAIVAAAGAIGLYWQIVLTRRALSLNVSATRAMEHQNRIAAAAQRAWIVPEPQLADVNSSDSSISFEWRCHFVNKGETLARNVIAHAKLFEVKEGDRAEEDDMRRREIVMETNGWPAVSLIPGEGETRVGWHFQVKSSFDWMSADADPFAIFHLVALVRYQIEGDDDWHLTERTFSLSQREDSFGRVLYKRLLDDFSESTVIFASIGGGKST